MVPVQQKKKSKKCTRKLGDNEIQETTKIERYSGRQRKLGDNKGKIKRKEEKKGDIKSIKL